MAVGLWLKCVHVIEPLFCFIDKALSGWCCCSYYPGDTRYVLLLVLYVWIDLHDIYCTVVLRIVLPTMLCAYIVEPMVYAYVHAGMLPQ